MTDNGLTELHKPRNNNDHNNNNKDEVCSLSGQHVHSSTDQNNHDTIQ